MATPLMPQRMDWRWCHRGGDRPGGGGIALDVEDGRGFDCGGARGTGLAGRIGMEGLMWGFPAVGGGFVGRRRGGLGGIGAVGTRSVV
jgi:hypothetical protein